MFHPLKTWFAAWRRRGHQQILRRLRPREYQAAGWMMNLALTDRDLLAVHENLRAKYLVTGIIADVPPPAGEDAQAWTQEELFAKWHAEPDPERKAQILRSWMLLRIGCLLGWD